MRRGIVFVKKKRALYSTGITRQVVESHTSVARRGGETRRKEQREGKLWKNGDNFSPCHLVVVGWVMKKIDVDDSSFLEHSSQRKCPEQRIYDCTKALFCPWTPSGPQFGAQKRIQNCLKFNPVLRKKLYDMVCSLTILHLLQLVLHTLTHPVITIVSTNEREKNTVKAWLIHTAAAPAPAKKIIESSLGSLQDLWSLRNRQQTIASVSCTLDN